jgi:hypothetical protein
MPSVQKIQEPNHINQLPNQSTDQPTNQPTNQSNNQSINHSTVQALNHHHPHTSGPEQATGWVFKPPEQYSPRQD